MKTHSKIDWIRVRQKNMKIYKSIIKLNMKYQPLIPRNQNKASEKSWNSLFGMMRCLLLELMLLKTLYAFDNCKHLVSSLFFTIGYNVVRG